MKKFAFLFVLIPVGIVVIALAVANNHGVELKLPSELGYAPFEMPLFALLFITLLIGMVLGSVATWFKQGKHRKQARAQKVEATKATFEAEKQKERAEKLASVVSAEPTDEQKAFAALGLPAPQKVA